MNFGKWIVVAFVLFALFIGTLVTVCVRQDISLVSKEYYKDELAYQSQIKRISNTNTLSDKPSIEKINSTTIQIKFRNSIDRGEVKLFCPSNSKMDRNFDIRLLETNSQLLDVSSLAAGMYRVKLFWTANQKEYFMEEVIYL